MNEDYKMINVALTLSIVGLAVFIIHRFIPSIIWAGIIAVATYPLYRRWRLFFGSYGNVSALLFTILLSLLILLPLSWLVSVLIKEFQVFINYLQVINKDGGSAPSFIQQWPFVGSDLTAYWDENIGKPGRVKAFLSNLHLSLSHASYYIKEIGVNLAHRSFQLAFTLLTLFFFYRDGDILTAEIDRIGENYLGQRWFTYFHKLPSALRGTVNGTILVGLGVGILMGICYAFVGVPAPTLLGFITAIAAMIPFVVPLVFIIIALTLFASGSLLSGIIVLIWGTLVVFIADHFIKPVLIGGAIKLPFLAVLFGILGGVETLGLLGLFVGPVVMVLFVTLWREPPAHLVTYEWGETSD